MKKKKGKWNYILPVTNIYFTNAKFMSSYVCFLTFIVSLDLF